MTAPSTSDALIAVQHAEQLLVRARRSGCSSRPFCLARLMAITLIRADRSCIVLDVATLTAPAFVDACLSRRSHTLDVAGEQFRVLDQTVPGSGTLREHFGDRAPIAVVPPDGSAVQICPGIAG